MGHYSIIHDEQEIDRFLALLPELLPNETFYGCLFARRKYDPSTIKSNDRTQLDRFTSHNLTYFKEHLEGYQRPVGSFKLTYSPRLKTGDSRSTHSPMAHVTLRQPGPGHRLSFQNCEY